MKYFDAHYHLSSDSEITHARDMNVLGFVCNATCPSDWGDIIKLVENNSDVYGAVGVHPWFIDGLNDDWENTLRDVLVKNPKLMVGEIGLDKSRPNIERQIVVFEQQLRVAHDLGRIVNLHCVRAWDLMLQILKKNRNKLPPLFVAHEYSGTPDMMLKLISDYNFYFSYGKRALNKPHHIQQTPRDRILVETDGNTPSMIVDITERIAAIANIKPDTIYKNATQVFIND